MIFLLRVQHCCEVGVEKKNNPGSGSGKLRESQAGHGVRQSGLSRV